MSEHMAGSLGCVSANHVISVRLITGSDGWIVQALTCDWAIDLERCQTFDEATMLLEDLCIKLRHQ